MEHISWSTEAWITPPSEYYAPVVSTSSYYGIDHARALRPVKFTGEPRLQPSAESSEPQ